MPKPVTDKAHKKGCFSFNSPSTTCRPSANTVPVTIVLLFTRNLPGFIPPKRFIWNQDIDGKEHYGTTNKSIEFETI